MSFGGEIPCQSAGQDADFGEPLTAVTPARLAHYQPDRTVPALIAGDCGNIPMCAGKAVVAGEVGVESP